jgi:uncharacterized protein (TIGR00369 family)
MYLAARCNAYYRPQVAIGEGTAEIRIEVDERFFHAADAVHGSVYFKALDDAAFFAANSLVDDVFVLTANFQLYLLRPVSEGTMIARGRVVSRAAANFVAASELFDERDRLLATGSGTFVRSRMKLADTAAYNDG